MHPNLEDPMYIDCSELIFQLQECRSQPFSMRMFSCNNISDEVNRCLHKARMQRRQMNNIEGRKRMNDVSKLRDEYLKDLYGKELFDRMRGQPSKKEEA
ncbi:hypothetical protein V1511DRAFT_502757 [Dipodascopsis uninucleata]